MVTRAQTLRQGPAVTIVQTPQLKSETQKFLKEKPSSKDQLLILGETKYIQLKKGEEEILKKNKYKGNKLRNNYEKKKALNSLHDAVFGRNLNIQGRKNRLTSSYRKKQAAKKTTTQITIKPLNTSKQFAKYQQARRLQKRLLAESKNKNGTNKYNTRNIRTHYVPNSILAPTQISTQKKATKTQRFTKTIYKDLTSPFIGVSKIGKKIVPKAFEGNKKTFADVLQKSRGEKGFETQGKIDPDVTSAILLPGGIAVSKIPKYGYKIAKTGVAGGIGYQGVKTVQNPSPEELGHLTTMIGIPAGVSKISKPIITRNSFLKSVNKNLKGKQRIKFEQKVQEIDNLFDIKIQPRNPDFKDLTAFRNNPKKHIGNDILKNYFSKNPDIVVAGSNSQRFQMSKKAAKKAKLPDDQDLYSNNYKKHAEQLTKQLNAKGIKTRYFINNKKNEAQLFVKQERKDIHLASIKKISVLEGMLAETQGLKSLFPKISGTRKSPNGTRLLDIKLQAQRQLVRSTVQGRTAKDISKAKLQLKQILTDARRIQKADRTSLLKNRKGTYYMRKKRKGLASNIYPYYNKKTIGTYGLKGGGFYSIGQPNTHYPSPLPPPNYPVFPNNMTTSTYTNQYGNTYTNTTGNTEQTTILIPGKKISKKKKGKKTKKYLKTTLAYQPIYKLGKNKGYGNYFKTKQGAIAEGIITTDKTPANEFSIKRVQVPESWTKKGPTTRKGHKFYTQGNKLIEKTKYRKDNKNENNELWKSIMR